MPNELRSLSALSDEELIVLLSVSPLEAEEELVMRYAPLVRLCTRPYYLVGGDAEDLIQEGMLALLKAIREFNPDKAASFSTFAELCVRNRIISVVRSANRDKHKPLNRYQSMHAFTSDESLSNAFVLQPGQVLDPEHLFLAREELSELAERWKVLLSGLEAEILGHYLQGLSYREIAAITHKTPKSVDNAVQRARQKLGFFRR